MNPTPEMLAMAQKICADDCDIPEIARNYLKGVRDETREVRIALAAITAVTERAAALAESLPSVTQSPKSGVTVWGPSKVATALRNFDHLKGATPNG